MKWQVKCGSWLIAWFKVFAYFLVRIQKQVDTKIVKHQFQWLVTCASHTVYMIFKVEFLSVLLSMERNMISYQLQNARAYEKMKKISEMYVINHPICICSDARIFFQDFSRKICATINDNVTNSTDNWSTLGMNV